MIITCFVYLLLGLFLTSCRKDEQLSVSGLVTDPNQDIPVSQAKVEIWTQQIESGVLSVNYILAGTAYAGADGRFQFELQNKNYTGIRLIISHDGYFGIQSEVDLGTLKNDRQFFAEYFLIPEAFLRIHVQNSDPFDSGDFFDFRIINGYNECEDCCKGVKYEFSGRDIDQVIDCRTSGNREIQIQWSKRKNGLQVYKNEIFFIKAFETTLIELSY